MAAQAAPHPQRWPRCSSHVRITPDNGGAVRRGLPVCQTRAKPFRSHYPMYSYDDLLAWILFIGKCLILEEEHVLYGEMLSGAFPVVHDKG